MSKKFGKNKVKDVKIIIGKDDEDFATVAEYATQIAEYENWFWFVWLECPTEKLVFCKDYYMYALENIADLKEKLMLNVGNNSCLICRE